MSAQKAHPAPIRRNLGIIDISCLAGTRFACRLLAFSFAEQLPRGAALQLIPKQLFRGDEEQRLAAGRPQISRRLHPPQARLLPPRSRRQQHLAQMARIHQHMPLPIRAVHGPNFRRACILVEIGQQFPV